MITYQNKADLLEFDLIGDIGESWWDDNAITVNKVKDMLNANKDKDLLFNVQSLGGNVFDALIIHDILKLHKGNVTARILGATASAGTIVALGAKQIEMSQNALFLIHNVWTVVMGNASDMRREADRMDEIDGRLVNIYQRASNSRGKNKKKSQIVSLMEEERWIDSAEAMTWGFIDKSIDVNKMAAKIDYDEFTAKFPQLPQVYLNKYVDMNLFKNKQKDAVINDIKTADGAKTFLFENELAEGSVINAIGTNDSLEGEYEIQGNKKITVDAENKVTSIEDIQASTEQPENVQEMFAQFKTEIMDAIKAELAPVFEKNAEIEEQFNALKSNGSHGKSMKTEGPDNSRKEVSPVNQIAELRKQKQAEVKNKVKKY